MDVSLDDIIERDRRDRQQQRRRGSGRGGGGAGGGRGAGRAEAPAVRAAGGGGGGSKPPPAGAAELREMDAFGRAKKAKVQDGAASKFGPAGRWGPAGRKGQGRAQARSQPYADWPSAGGGGGGWGKNGSRGKGGKARGWEWDGGWDVEVWDEWEADPRGPTRITLGNLDSGVMPSDLQEMFEEFGVQKTWIDYDSTDRSVGTGGASFATAGGAAAACRRFHGAMVDGQKVYVQLESGGGKGKGKGGKGKGKAKGKGWDW